MTRKTMKALQEQRTHELTRLLILLERWTERREYWAREEEAHGALEPTVSNTNLCLWARIRREAYEDCIDGLRYALRLDPPPSAATPKEPGHE